MEKSMSFFCRRACVALVALLLCSGWLQAEPLLKMRNDTTFRHPWETYAVAGTLLLGGGLAGHLTDHDYSNQQTSYFPHRSSTLDDIVRWVPTMARLGLRVAGIHGRSDLNRLLVGRVASWGMNFGITEVLKRTVKQTRPDGSDNRSTPSGHAALVFMSAAVLDEEYGYISPLIPLGGYAVSTAVAFNRTLGNHHYPGDVLLGAGIGLLTTKLGYIFADKVLKRNSVNDRDDDIAFASHPSFLGFYGAYRLSVSNLHAADGLPIRLQPGLEVGLQGAWFPCKYVGVGGRLSESHAILRKNAYPVNAWIDCLSARGGVYFSLPVSASFNIGSHLLAGYSVQTGGRNELRALKAPALEGMVWEAGLTGSYLLRENLDIRLQFDYQTINGTHTLRSVAPSVGLSYSF